MLYILVYFLLGLICFIYNLKKQTEHVFLKDKFKLFATWFFVGPLIYLAKAAIAANKIFERFDEV